MRSIPIFVLQPIQQSNASSNGTETLPDNWNEKKPHYTLKYVCNRKEYILIGHVCDTELYLTLKVRNSTYGLICIEIKKLIVMYVCVFQEHGSSHAKATICNVDNMLNSSRVKLLDLLPSNCAVGFVNKAFKSSSDSSDRYKKKSESLYCFCLKKFFLNQDILLC